MRKTIVISVSIFLLIGLATCKKDNTQLELFGDGLSGEDLLFLDTISIENLPLDSMIGFNGDRLAKSTSSLLAAKLIDGMLRQAQNLSELKKNELHSSLGEFSPEHYGIAYSSGQRNLEVRNFPPLGNALHRSYAVFGTDCSGLMINLLISQGVKVSNCSVSTFEKSLREALKQNETYKSVKVENEGYLPLKEIENGDFILWPGHMGIVSKRTDGTIACFQSNGTDSPIDLDDQKKNWGLQRGVNPIDLNKAVNGKGYWGSGYSIIRLIDKTQLITYKVTPLSNNIAWDFPQCSTTCYASFNNLSVEVSFDSTNISRLVSAKISYTFKSFMPPPYTSDANPICFYSLGQLDTTVFINDKLDNQNNISVETPIEIMCESKVGTSAYVYLIIHRSTASIIDSANFQCSYKTVDHSSPITKASFVRLK